MSRIFLATPGAGTWTVPSDWNNSDFTIELIGAGANGTNQFSPGGFDGGGAGGAGGQYAIKTSADVTPLVLTPGAVVNFQVGAGGANTSTVAGVPGAYFAWDTWFNTSDDVFAQGAWTDASNLSHQGQYHPPGLGLAGGAPYPWHWNDGGGSPNVDAAQAANGGGGAGGPNGPGGTAASAGGLWEGGSGGGAANGGSNGGANFNSGGGFIGLGGGNGGNNRLGSGGGLGSTGTLGGPGALALPGTDGGGGGGGYGRRDGGLPVPGAPANAWCSSGANGSTDAVWGGIYGPGSGGGGAGGGNCDAGPVGAAGGNGGQFGGGGGGASDGSSAPGLGGQGLIVITYSGTGSADGRGRLRTRYVRKILGQ